MRSADTESGAELPASLWEALLYDAADPMQVLQVHEPADGIAKKIRTKYGKEKVAEFRTAFAEECKERSRDKRVFRGTANAFLVFAKPKSPNSGWTFRFREIDVEVDVRTVHVRLGG